jgi:hypothetical protein
MPLAGMVTSMKVPPLTGEHALHQLLLVATEGWGFGVFLGGDELGRSIVL